MFWLLPIAVATATIHLSHLGFEQDFRGWAVSGHNGFRADVLSNSDAAEGAKYMRAGWRARNAAPHAAEIRITTSINAEPYHGHRVRFSAMTRVPTFAAGASSLIATTSGAMPLTRVRIDASEDWRSHSIDVWIPHDARTITFGFVVAGTGGELDADATQLEILD